MSDYTASAAEVKALREATGAGIMECKNVLREANGDQEAAVKLLRERGIAKTGKRADRTTKEGVIEAYVHGGRIGVLVEVKGGSADLSRGIAMHVAAMNPPYISEKHVPADFIAKEKEIELAKMTDKDKAKPAEILEKIIGGKVAKIINENTLTGQPYVLDTNEAVGNVLKKEGAEVLSMHRIAVGEGIDKPVGEDFATEVMKQAGLA